jgi:hypothetical protein
MSGGHVFISHYVGDPIGNRLGSKEPISRYPKFMGRGRLKFIIPP